MSKWDYLDQLKELLDDDKQNLLHLIKGNDKLLRDYAIRTAFRLSDPSFIDDVGKVLAKLASSRYTSATSVARIAISAIDSLFNKPKDLKVSRDILLYLGKYGKDGGYNYLLSYLDKTIAFPDVSAISELDLSESLIMLEDKSLIDPLLKLTAKAIWPENLQSHSAIIEEVIEALLSSNYRMSHKDPLLFWTLKGICIAYRHLVSTHGINEWAYSHLKQSIETLKHIPLNNRSFYLSEINCVNGYCELMWRANLSTYEYKLDNYGQKRIDNFIEAASNLHKDNIISICGRWGLRYFIGSCYGNAFYMFNNIVAISPSYRPYAKINTALCIDSWIRSSNDDKTQRLSQRNVVLILEEVINNKEYDDSIKKYAQNMLTSCTKYHSLKGISLMGPPDCKEWLSEGNIEDQKAGIFNLSEYPICQ